MTRSRMTLLCLLSVAVAVLSCQVRADEQKKKSAPTALDRYVAEPDPAYSYKLVDTLKGDGVTGYVLRMTSQKWLTEKEVNHPVWEHWLTIMRPDKVGMNKSMLFITGGSRDRGAPKSPDKMLATFAKATGSVVAELRGVPNQPLQFEKEGRDRVEDELIAYTWDKYLRTGDERWPARLPMTKAAVRAMDTVTDFCAKKESGGVKVDSFVVSGGSKRGWTAWTTAAVDKRVVAVIPIVIDTLNVQASGAHHFKAYGFFAPSLGDYVEMGLQDWFGKPEYQRLLDIEEPYEYRERLTMPKFIINATGDQYFPPDNSQFYFHELPGVKYLRYVPNADHSLDGTDAPETVLGCYAAVLTGAPLPKLSWEIEGENAIRVKTQDRPVEVRLWQATNPKARDFRVETLGKVWQSRTLKEESPGVYVGKVEKPAHGWTAFMVELTYPTRQGAPPLKFTTQVRIVPDVLPFKFPPEEAQK